MQRKPFSKVRAARFIKKHDKENTDFSKKKFSVLECCAITERLIAAMIKRLTNSSSVAKDSTRGHSKIMKDEPMYKRFLDQAVKLK